MDALNNIKAWFSHHATSPNNRLQKKASHVTLFSGIATTNLLAAEKLAKENGKEVYRVDLSKVVSKYIGETEKNIDAVFKKAEGKDWVLFFDEADALFGKRTNIKDAHDRYANLEVAYLLQKMEAYHGLAILATNGKENLDEGFVRRFHSVVYFPK